MDKKETFWLIGTTILVLILNTLIFGIDGLKADYTLDINIPDTYFVIENIHFILLVGVLVFFGIYLLRTFRRTFEKLGCKSDFNDFDNTSDCSINRNLFNIRNFNTTNF